MNFQIYLSNLHPIVWLIVIGVMVIFISYHLKSRMSFKKIKKTETPHEILQRKLANGLIDLKEFEQQKRFLDREEDLKLKSFFMSRM